MKLHKFLNEKLAISKVVLNKYTEVFENPSNKERKDLPNETRGYITNNGNLYVSSNDRYLHGFIYNSLIEKGYISKKAYDSGTLYSNSWKYGFGIIFKRENKIARVYVDKFMKKYSFHEEEIDEVLKKAKDKNPTIDFVNEIN